jgi:CDP-glucose 4,6-dehydratase
MGGHDPYSASKGCAELATAAWRRSFLGPRGVRVASARAGNVIGGGDWAEDRIVPDAMRALDQGEKIAVRNPKAVRPWQHVLDPLYGYVLTLEAALSSTELEAVNFGPLGGSLSVSEVAKIAKDNWPQEVNYEFKKNELDESRESLVLQLDSKKAQKVLGWNPKWSQTEAIVKTVRWWDLVLNQGLDPIDVCKQDLEEFLS